MDVTERREDASRPLITICTHFGLANEQCFNLGRLMFIISDCELVVLDSSLLFVCVCVFFLFWFILLVNSKYKRLCVTLYVRLERCENILHVAYFPNIEDYGFSLYTTVNVETFGRMVNGFKMECGGIGISLCMFLRLMCITAIKCKHNSRHI